MDIIAKTEALADFCVRAADAPYVTIDTEFLRERTYYSKLCLIQMAFPGDGKKDAVLVDPLKEGISLDPFYNLLKNRNVVKVLHAARQDLEIFYIEGGVIPAPLFDTQVAAMVCGYGEQVGYETLVRRIARQQLDKTSRFTDWSRRPLTEAQQKYALADVTHLRAIYEYLAEKLEKSGRTHWVEEELQILSDPGTYAFDPGEAWRRVKTRHRSGAFLALVREIAQFRESYAQARNVPRNRIFKDEVLLEIASAKPRTAQDLGKLRLLLRDARKGEIAEGILAAVDAGLKEPSDAWPETDAKPELSNVNPALADMLRVLLKAKAEDAGVAQKLIATASDLDAIAAGDRDGLAFSGWRRDVFGEDALRLCNGEIGLAVNGEKVGVIEI